MRSIWITTIALISALTLQAQDRNIRYIEEYKSIAIREMQQYGIPASITLAQGILESAGGESYLARKANNHFGIKCHEDWEGGTVYRDDDRKNECFRSYKNPEESFRDHSLFLANRSRYAFLFDEDPTDYKAWARGLKKAGYATNPKYPSLLIELIERYDLHQYDQMETIQTLAEMRGGYQMLETEKRLKYVVATGKESWEELARSVEVKVRKLLKYNELRYDDTLYEGQRIYLQKKKRNAPKRYKYYRVQQGETTYEIAQKMGIRLRFIYKRNDALKVGEQPSAGDQLKLRWTLF